MNLPSFTAKQMLVLMGLMQDRTLKEIAATLNITTQAVGYHVRRIHQKTETHTLHGIICWFVANGLIINTKKDS